ncbi:MAG: tRNA (guanosine(37)-N1)-methyltransferase TrmD [Deltaproteobacteria bacterium]|nr:tRNA (guanosine(37)-N1)-methyltransferase TrmD [Deltaproteobacteria bacterium]
MTFELVTLFPELFDGFLRASLLGRAVTTGIIAVEKTNLRDFGTGRHRSVDDTPSGGGPGMILSAPPIAAALDDIHAKRGPAHKILLSPRGRLLDQTQVRRLAGFPRIVLVCGRYEGFDERVSALCDEELSLGDYVLAGGELAAAVVIEAIARLVPGVLGSSLSAVDESFSHGRLEYPQWTRPLDFRGESVPPVLLSGDHAAIKRWRRREAFQRTLTTRPDLIDRYPPNAEERAWMREAAGRETDADPDLPPKNNGA